MQLLALSTLKVLLKAKGAVFLEKTLAEIINLLFKKLHVTTNTHLTHFLKDLQTHVYYGRSLARTRD